jgi:murein DD-endopeptidase MepM/ murein hydrolase activator NlpD
MFCMEKYKKCFDFFILVLLTVGLTGCINSYKDSQQNLILKGSVAELKETVMLDPAFAARQKQAEKSFFGFSEVIENADYSKSLLSDEEEFEGNDENSLVSLETRNGKFGGLEIIWPTAGNLTSLFGMRKLGKRTRMHAGIDIGARVGTPIHSSYDGQVLFAGVKRGYGFSVILGHDAEHETLYAHMSKIKVKTGQFVRRDQVIGYVGKTGRVTGANLHYETRIAGVAYNPLQFLPPFGDKKMQVGMKTPSLSQQLNYYLNRNKLVYNKAGKNLNQ